MDTKTGEQQIHIPAGQSVFFVVAVRRGLEMEWKIIMRKRWLNWHFQCACKDAAQRLLEAQALQAERAAMASEYHAQAEEQQAEMARIP